MINVYFKSKGKLIAIAMPESDFSLAQTNAYLLAVENGYTPSSPILAVIK